MSNSATLLRLMKGAGEAAVYLVLCAGPLHAETQPDVTPRFAVHETFDRLVLTLPPGAHFTSQQVTSQQVGTDVKLVFSGVGHVYGLVAPGHRLLALTGREGEASLQLAPNTHLHLWQIGNRLVVDVDDAAPPVAATKARQAAPTPPDPSKQTKAQGTAAAQVLALRGKKLVSAERRPPQPALAARTPMSVVPPTPLRPFASVQPVASEPLTPPAAPVTAAQPVIAAQPAAGPVDLAPVAPAAQRAAVTLLGEDTELGGPAMLVPFGVDTGAAAFRRGGEAHIVFDTARPLDLSQLKDDPDFGGVTERLLPDGMHLSMKLADDAQIRMARRDGGWALALVHGLPKLTAIAAHLDKGILSLAAAAPGRVVVLDDEATGGKLLIGPQRKPGQYVPSAHRSAEFALPETWQGVVVEPVTDRLALRALRDGFSLMATDGPKLSASWAEAPQGADARVMTRRFDLPDLPEALLHNRTTLAKRDAALTPKLSRFPARLRVAQALLAEGLDVDARAVLHVAAADDPAHADDPDVAGLLAITNWLHARAGGTYPSAENFDPASLGNSDEAQFWQALFKAPQQDVSAPAATLSATWPLLLQYPDGLRRRLAADVGQILGRGGQDRALAALLAAVHDPSLDLARAGLLQRQGKIDEALALLDAVGKGSNRLMRAEALRDAVEMRLAAKKIDVAAAAAALGRQLYAWRGGPSDLALRLRVADLRMQAGKWRQALSLLRETDGLFPDDHARIHDAETNVVSALLRGDSAQKLSALDLVTLADEASSLLTAADADATLAPVLVDKLLALDLPARAEPILQRLFDHAGTPEQRAELGVRLAGLMADRGDAKDALMVLGQSDDAGLASSLVTRRGLLRARLLVASGKAADALGVLSGVPGEEAVELQAKILEDRHEWAGASKVLETLTAGAAFASKPDQAQRDLILRLANDESQAGDMAALRRLRGAQGAHMSSGPGAELFAVLTQEPIKAVADLPRSGHELDAVRALPASLATR